MIRYKMCNELNPTWKGDKAGYDAIHSWVRKRKPKPKYCEICNKRSPYDLANISGEYKRDINDYQWICRKCHLNKDGHIKNLEKGRKGRKKGFKHSIKTKEKIKASFTPERKRELKELRLGKEHTELTKRKIKLSMEKYWKKREVI